MYAEWRDILKPYNPKNIPLAISLRKKMTPWERKLWYQFLRTYPIRIQRQKAIGEYIADFYCAKAQLVIELDRRATNERYSANTGVRTDGTAGFTVL